MVTGKWKLYEIYRRMCDVNGEVCFSQKKMFANRLNMCLSLWACVKKKVN